MLSNQHKQQYALAETPMWRLNCDRELQIVFRSGSRILTDSSPTTTSVEKDGTGIKAMDGYRRHFANGLRANITQDVYMEQGRSGCPGIPSGTSRQITQTTWQQ